MPPLLHLRIPMRVIPFLFFYFLIGFSLSAQEFRGIDFRISPDFSPGFPDGHLITIDLYLKSPDSVQMDSISIASSGWEKVHKTAHLFFEDDVQLLRFNGQITISIGIISCFTEEYLLEEIINYHNGSQTPIRFFSEFLFSSSYNEDPYFNALQTDAYFEDGVFYFDASGVDPNGQNLGYYLETLFFPDTSTENYQLPVGTDTIRLDPLTGALVWDRPTVPGKYLIVIEYAQSFAAVPPAWAGTSTRYMVIDVKPEDIVLSNEEQTCKQEIKVFPNPAISGLSIHIESKAGNNPTKLSITNLIGQNIYSETLPVTANKIKKEIKTTSWTPGIYLLSLQSGDEVWTEKVVVY